MSMVIAGCNIMSVELLRLIGHYELPYQKNYQSPILVAFVYV